MPGSDRTGSSISTRAAIPAQRSTRTADATTPRLADYRYSLAGVEIAQTPAPQRDGARLLVLDRASGEVEHRGFHEFPDVLRPGDLLVLNDTRVFPARLRARKATGGRVEILLVESVDGEGGAAGVWRALGQPGKGLAPGTKLVLEDEDDVTITSRARDAHGWLIELRRGAKFLTVAEVHELCERRGEVPLPPYIRRESDEERHDPSDRQRYQTVYARNTGAVAAPTAGLHFTDGVLERLAHAGVDTVRISLHVGLGTFRPLDARAFAAPTLHAERFEISREAGERIRAAGRRGERVVAVGTTTVRALESLADEVAFPYRARTDIFIKPGHRFRNTGAVVTNFHLPESSTLVLACAFAGRENLLSAYAEAIRRGYRFYSFGDAMLIV